MVHDGPPGMVDTIYRGGKGDFVEGGVRVPAMAWWPGVIGPEQLHVGAVGYFYDQIIADSGAGDRVGSFESRVVSHV
jgi:arylsulfatase A-like enzyme